MQAVLWCMMLIADNSILKFLFEPGLIHVGFVVNKVLNGQNVYELLFIRHLHLFGLYKLGN